jgi:hypothetical protein
MLARGWAYLHTAPLPVPKNPAAKPCVSITSKLIQTKRLQLHYFAHLRKTGGRGSYRLVHTGGPPRRKPHGTKFNHSRTSITFSSRAPRYSFTLGRAKGPLSPLFPLHTKSSPVTPLFPLLMQKQGSTPPSNNVGAPTFLIFPHIFRSFSRAQADPGNRRDVPTEFFERPKCKKTFHLSPGFRMGRRSNEPALEWLKEKVGGRGYQ